MMICDNEVRNYHHPVRPGGHDRGAPCKGGALFEYRGGEQG